MIFRLLLILFGLERNLTVFLGSQKQKGSLIAIIEAKTFWNQESLSQKLRSILRLNWKISNSVLERVGKQCFIEDLFGTENDYGEHLYNLMIWHNSQEWQFESLKPEDIEKSEGIDAMSIITRLRHSKITSGYLNLSLGIRSPEMCFLVHPMVVKIPVISVRYCLDIHSRYAFNKIRKSNHPYADDLISYLYEILFIQQKIATSLHEYVRLLDYADKEKQDSLLTNAEVDSIKEADLIFSYLKASIEKTISLIGLTYNITNLDSKKTHKQKIDILIRELPNFVKDQPYWAFVFEFIKPENLEVLNNYRSGLLHKKGISDLQPHKYVGEKAEKLPLRKIYRILHEQHSKNSAVLLGALAILTDKLVKLDPPDISISEIMEASLLKS